MRRLKKPPRRLRLAAADLVDKNGEIRAWASNNATKQFRSDLTAWCMKKHGARCAYCSLSLGLNHRRSKALDHFVPKGKRTGVPDWTYELYNLLLSCESCNSKIKASKNPLLSSPKIRYRRASFSLFHPYLDRLEEHIEGGYRGGRDVPSTPKPLSTKGQRTIDTFDLTNPTLRNTWEGERLAAHIQHKRQAWTGTEEKLVDAALLELRVTRTIP